MSAVKVPLISIITINYNQTNLTCEFLRSLTKLDYPSYEVIVIDNYSKGNPTTLITVNFPSVRFFRTKKNLGFTGGNNLGMRLAQGEYFLLLNNDTEVIDPKFIEKLLAPFRQHESVAMVSPKILYHDPPNVIQYAGYEKVNPLTGRNGQIGEGQHDSGQYSSSFTNYAHGAAMLVKRAVAEQIGIFTDHFFLCYEELDWSARCINSGFKIYFQNDTHIVHKESSTMGKESPMKVYYNNRNRIMFMRRNSTTLQFFIFLCYFIVLTIPKNVLSFAFKRQWAHLKSFVQAIWWNIANFAIYKREPFTTKIESISLDVIDK